MSKLDWTHNKMPKYESGIDRGVFYPKNAPGVCWHGLTSVDENTNAEDPTAIFLDGVKILDLPVQREYTSTLSCYTYPDEFLDYDGYDRVADGVLFGEQMPKTFDLSYRTLINGGPHYKIHLVYNAIATPANVSRKTLSNTPEPATMSWKLNCVPNRVRGRRPTSYVVLDSSKLDSGLLRFIEGVLYGTDDSEPKIMSPEDLVHYSSDVNPVVVTELIGGEFELWAPSFYLSQEGGVYEYTGPTFEELPDGMFSVSSEENAQASLEIQLGAQDG